MGNPSLRLPASQVAADLQQATNVAGKHGIHKPISLFPSSSLGTSGSQSLKDILDLALPETFRHFRLGEVVTARRPAADFRLVQREQFQPRNHLQQLSRLSPNLLAMTKMAGIMINCSERHRMLRLDRPQLDEKLADVPHLGCQRLGGL